MFETRQHALSSLLLSTCFLLAVVLFGAQPARADSAGDLFESLNERLGFMRDVARYKAQQQLPIEDLPREAIVLQNSAAAAAAAGLEPDSVVAFFTMQITLAKVIQFRQRADLLTAATSLEALDLDGEIRPALDLLGERIIVQLADRLHTRGPITEADWAQFDHSVREAYLSLPEKRLLFESLLPVRAR